MSQENREAEERLMNDQVLKYCQKRNALKNAKATLDTAKQRYDTLLLDLRDALTDLSARVETAEKAIREHRDARGDDRCWMDDETLYRVLPEGYTPPVRDTSVELKRCEQFIAKRHNPATVYISPQRRIEQAEARILELEATLQRRDSQ